MKTFSSISEAGRNNSVASMCVEGCGVTEVLNISCAPALAVVLVQLRQFPLSVCLML